MKVTDRATAMATGLDTRWFMWYIVASVVSLCSVMKSFRAPASLTCASRGELQDLQIVINSHRISQVAKQMIILIYRKCNENHLELGFLFSGDCQNLWILLGSREENILILFLPYYFLKAWLAWTSKHFQHISSPLGKKQRISSRRGWAPSSRHTAGMLPFSCAI